MYVVRMYKLLVISSRFTLRPSFCECVHFQGKLVANFICASKFCLGINFYRKKTIGFLCRRITSLREEYILEGFFTRGKPSRSHTRWYLSSKTVKTMDEYPNALNAFLNVGGQRKCTEFLHKKGMNR